MKAINFLNTKLVISSTRSVSAGHGYKKINVELCCELGCKSFAAITSDMEAYDNACDLERQEKDEALFNIISYKIKDEVDEWLILL